VRVPAAGIHGDHLDSLPYLGALEIALQALQGAKTVAFQNYGFWPAIGFGDDQTQAIVDVQAHNQIGAFRLILLRAIC
jgi:hypothetical protein